ncbi:sensor histidine kinase [Paenibacillus sp. J5C_2022]|uniref:sensor histidine kinase n=1 Tax=Paenibacillus sp. J5C2022 TaxID=2977129 RepID=UPI0021D12622|nr:sensor histidine kinase [Paenibacillus sp. J5C2022]MCU6711432.1 sensor histidine kinase [Paenibacillus sp. J5C2022]
MNVRHLLHWLWPDTLKGRLSILLIFVTITPIVLIGFTSYFWFYQIQMEKINASYETVLRGERDALEKAFDNFASVSQLLAADGGLGDDIALYIQSEDPFEKTKYFRSIDRSLTNIIYSNPAIHAIFIYFEEHYKAIQFENAPLKHRFMSATIDDMPFVPLFRANQLTYNSPHPTVRDNSDKTVLSLLRPIPYGNGQIYYVYLETEWMHHVPLGGEDGGTAGVYHSLIGSDGLIRYSNLPIELREGASLDDERVALSAFKSFAIAGKNGWKLVSHVKLSVYEKEVQQWRILYVIMSCLSLVLTVGAVSYIWRMVYRPLQTMNKAMNRFSHDGNHLQKLHTRLTEFEVIYSSFRDMSRRIVELITEVEQKEKRKGELEVEKLIAQINPHFLHNTLNTIQWLALEKGQREIYDLVKVFTRVLQYNLGKRSMIVTIREELAALNDYIELQNIRYDHRFKVDSSVDSDIAEVPIPRFVLQPIVENALYHGVSGDQDRVVVHLKRSPGRYIQITVADSGQGMNPDTVAALLRGEEGKSTGIGIGLNYVQKMLDVHYGDLASMSIDSRIGEGTTVTIVIPDSVKGEGEHDQGVARG